MSSLVLIIIAVLLSAFFSGMEIAYISSNKLRIELDIKKGKFPHQILAIFIKTPSQYIATMLVGNNIALVVYGILMANLLDPAINISSEILALLIQTFISTIIILFFAEFIPKAIFRIQPNLTLNILSVPVFIFYIILFPIAKFSIYLSIILIKIFVGKKIDLKKKDYVFNKIDLNNLVNEGNELNSNGKNEPSDIKIFQNALDFSEVKLRECMVPRTEIIASEIQESNDALTKQFIESGHSRVLIYKESIDNIVGYINSKELFKKPKDIISNLIELLIVPETMPANKLLSLFINENKSVAIVVDEFGGTAGMVTIEDILEEIFGEIEDEHDIKELIEKKINDKEYIFSGRIEIDYINEKFNLTLPKEGDYETLAGFIIYHFESLPKVNEYISINNFQIKILKTTSTRIDLVKLFISDF